MRQELQQAIADWKSGSNYENRQVTAYILSTGEYVITISAAIDLIVENKQESVYEYKFLMTMAQSPDSTLNPAGDVFQFKKAGNLVESKFLDRCSMVIEQFLIDINPVFKPI